jgi:putative endonuclease
MDDRAALGRAGEKESERFLRRLGYRIVCRNYRCPAGEIDLVALDDKVIVFVEVKTRSDSDHADPEDAVNPAKQRHLIASARFFIRQTGSDNRPCRFDVLALIVNECGGLDVRHTRSAFTPRW